MLQVEAVFLNCILVFDLIKFIYFTFIYININIYLFICECTNVYRRHFVHIDVLCKHTHKHTHIDTVRTHVWQRGPN